VSDRVTDRVSQEVAASVTPNTHERRPDQVFELRHVRNCATTPAPMWCFPPTQPARLFRTTGTKPRPQIVFSPPVTVDEILRFGPIVLPFLKNPNRAPSRRGPGPTLSARNREPDRVAR